jgi:hypothetical protein
MIYRAVFGSLSLPHPLVGCAAGALLGLLGYALGHLIEKGRR